MEKQGQGAVQEKEGILFLGIMPQKAIHTAGKWSSDLATTNREDFNCY